MPVIFYIFYSWKVTALSNLPSLYVCPFIFWCSISNLLHVIAEKLSKEEIGDLKELFIFKIMDTNDKQRKECFICWWYPRGVRQTISFKESFLLGIHNRSGTYAFFCRGSRRTFLLCLASAATLLWSSRVKIVVVA